MPAMAASPSIVANFSWMSGVLVTRLNPSRISLRHSLLVCPEVIPIIERKGRDEGRAREPVMTAGAIRVERAGDWHDRLR